MPQSVWDPVRLEINSAGNIVGLDTQWVWDLVRLDTRSV